MPHSYSSTLGWERVDKRQINSKEIRTIEGKEVALVNLEEKVWEGITRGDIVDYYTSIYPYLKPYLQDHPVGINVSFDPITEDEEFIRGMEGHEPKWATIFKTDRKNPKPGKSETIDWIVLNDLPSVIFNISLGAIDLHPWTARSTSPNNPDYIVIDLDPTDEDFSKVIETAKAAKEFIDIHQLVSFVKTSGKTGLHILLPSTGIEFGNARKIALHICSAIHEMLPDITTLSTSKSSRGDKVYVDPSQNDYADRIASVYSVRSYKQPNVSTPIQWEEVNSELIPSNFNIYSIFGRIEKVGDLFREVLNPQYALNNEKVLKRLI